MLANPILTRCLSGLSRSSFVLTVRSIGAAVIAGCSLCLLLVSPNAAAGTGYVLGVAYAGYPVSTCLATPNCAGTMGSTPAEACVNGVTYWVGKGGGGGVPPGATNPRLNGNGACIYDYNNGLNTSSGTSIATLQGDYSPGPVFDLNTSACQGYANVKKLVEADGYIYQPTYENVAGSPGLVRVTGAAASKVNGVQAPNMPAVSYTVDCTGTNPAGSGQKFSKNDSVAVDTDFAKCGAGSYAYKDETQPGSPSHCVLPHGVRTDPLTDCTADSGLGTFNGTLVCLKPNPAPEVAQASAKKANDQADIAKAAGAGTQAAIDAANLAIAAAQKAMDAAQTMPQNAVVQSYGQQAVAAAKQAAGYAGLGTPAVPSTVSGTGVGTAGQSELDGGPKECGSPGRPKCQIDETGTPSDASPYFEGPNAALDASEQAAKDLQASATSATGKNTGWSFTFSLPSACQAIPIYEGVVVDLCQWQPVIHDLMSLAWIGACIFGCIGMVGSTLRQSNG